MDKQRRSENVSGAKRSRSASWQPQNKLSLTKESLLKGDEKSIKLKVENRKKDRCIELYERPRTPHFCTDKRHSHGDAVPMSTAKRQHTSRKTDGLPRPLGNRTKNASCGDITNSTRGSLNVKHKPATFDNKCVGTTEIKDLFADSVTSSNKTMTKTYKSVYIDTADLINFSSDIPVNSEDFAVAANTAYKKPQVPDEEAGYHDPLPPIKSPAEIYIPNDFHQLGKHAEQASDHLLDSFDDLLEFLLKDLTTKVAKVRAIFRWCQSQKLTFATKPDPCNIDTPRGFINCIRQRLASLPELFAILCRKVDIPCVIIHGQSKGTGYDVGDKVTFQTGHTSWNAVFLESSWYFVQPRCTGNTMNSYTTGHWVLVESDQFCSKDLLKICDHSRNIPNDFFFLTGPAKFITRFFPERPEWQLLEKPLTKREFEHLPFLQPAFYELELSVKSHPGCIVQTSQGRVVIKIGMPLGKCYHFGYTLYSLRDLNSEGEHCVMLLQRSILHYFCAGDAVFDLRFPTTGIYKLELYCTDQEKALNSDWICDYRIVCSDVMPDFMPLPTVPSIGWGPGSALTEAGLECLSHNEAIVYQHHDAETSFRLVSLNGDTVDVVANLLSCSRSADELKHNVLIQTEENNVILKVSLPEEGEYALQIFAKDAQDNRKNICNFLLLRKYVTEVGAGIECTKIGGNAADIHSDLKPSASKSPRQINKYHSATHEEDIYIETASKGIDESTYNTEKVTADFHQVDKGAKIHATSKPRKVTERQVGQEPPKNPTALKQGSVKSADDIGPSLQHQKTSAHQIPSSEKIEKEVLATLDFHTTQRTAELESSKVGGNVADCHFDIKPSAPQPPRQIDNGASPGASQEENSYFNSETASINIGETTYHKEKDSTDFQQVDNANDTLMLATSTTIKVTERQVREKPPKPPTAFELIADKSAEDSHQALQPHKANADQIPSLEKLDNKVHATMNFHATQVTNSDHSSLRDLVLDLVFSKNITNELEICRTIYLWLATKDINAMSFVNVLPGSPEEVFKEIKTDRTTYSEIFNTLCIYAGLHSKVIHGYVKGLDYRLGQKFVPDSNRGSWNAVCIDGTWCLIDADWGARVRVSKEELHYRFEEYFFLPDPAQLIYSHLPDDPEWQLLEQRITLEEFENMPYMKTTFFKYGLELLNHKTTAVCCHDDIVIKMGYPVHKMIELSFDIELETGEKEYKGVYDNVKLNRYGMLETIEGVALLRLRLPKKGSYKLSIFVRENTSVNVDTLSKLVCEFKIVQVEVKSVEPEPFPPCDGHSWGLRGDFFRHGLSTPHQTAIVLTRDRKAQLQFTLPKLMTFKSIMKSNKDSDSELESSCQIRIVDKTAYFEIAAPGRGEYGLEIYASDSAAQDTSMSRVAQYLIKCKQDLNTVQIRKPFGSALGPGPKFFELGLHTLSHPDPVIRLEKNSVRIELTTRQEMAVKTELINADTENDVSDYVFMENKVYLITFVISLPEVGLYKFLLYANYARNTSIQLYFVYNYSINCKRITKEPHPVPKKLSGWDHDCFVESPLILKPELPL